MVGTQCWWQWHTPPHNAGIARRQGSSFTHTHTQNQYFIATTSKRHEMVEHRWIESHSIFSLNKWLELLKLTFSI